MMSDRVGAAWHRGSMPASHPAVPGSNFGTPNFVTNVIFSVVPKNAA